MRTLVHLLTCWVCASLGFRIHLKPRISCCSQSFRRQVQCRHVSAFNSAAGPTVHGIERSHRGYGRSRIRAPTLCARVQSEPAESNAPVASTLQSKPTKDAAPGPLDELLDEDEEYEEESDEDESDELEFEPLSETQAQQIKDSPLGYLDLDEEDSSVSMLETLNELKQLDDFKLEDIAADLDDEDYEKYNENKPEERWMDFIDEDVTALPMDIAGHRAGFVCIVGIPNVGKSTLLNAMLGEKLCITTPKAQTTRHRICAIANEDEDDKQGHPYQIVFFDTPGMIRPQYKMQEAMMMGVRGSLSDAEVILLLVDVYQDAMDIEEKLMKQLQDSPAAVIVLLNKVDLIDPDLHEDEDSKEQAINLQRKLGTKEELQNRWRGRFPSATVMPISAKLAGEDVTKVKRSILALLPEHPPYYPKDWMTDRPDRFFAAELLREAIFDQYFDEIPYSCECRCTSFKEDEEADEIHMNFDIYVSEESQSAILIGKQGLNCHGFDICLRANDSPSTLLQTLLLTHSLKKCLAKVSATWGNVEGKRRHTRLGKAIKKLRFVASKRMQEYWDGAKIKIKTDIKVLPNWRQNIKALRKFGYMGRDEEEFH